MHDMRSYLERDLRRSRDAIDDSVRDQVRAEQARLLWSHAYLLLALGVMVGLALVAAQWSVIDHAVLLGWLGLLLGVTAAWGLAALHYHRRGRAALQSHRWLHYGAGASLAYGLAWSVAAFALFPAEAFAHQAILTVMLAGMSAGAITILSTVSVTGVAFVFPTLLPLAYQYVLSGTTSALLILAMLLVFLLTLVMANRHLYTTLYENLRLRIEKAISESALHESESRYRLMFNQSPLGVLHYDTEGTVLDCNDTFVEILGTSRKEVLGTSMTASVSDEKMAAAVRMSLDTGWGYYEDTYRPVCGIHDTPLRAFFNAVRRSDGEILGGVGIVEDFTQRKRAEEAIHYQAYYDPLTDLPNRRLLDDRLDQVLAICRRHRRFGALVFLDLDHFKRINDWHGHAAGDQVLKTVAERLATNVRREDTVARLSGDEFIVLLTELGNNEAVATKGVQAVCEKLQTVLQEPLDVGGETFRLTASLGVTLLSHGGATAQDLLRQSDTAMYRAKSEVRGEVRFYEAGADDTGAEHGGLEDDLRFAMERDELSLHFQPVMDAAGVVIGAESLLRWEHPEHGMISPSQFIPLAEENGLIIAIGRWALDQVCCRLNELEANAGLHLPRIAVNVSAREFHHPEFVRRVESILDRNGVDGRRLVMEVTENVVIDRIAATVKKMEQLRAYGVRFEVDDFGTGYSSLAYLKRLPVDGIKIDRSFIRDLESDSSDAAIVEAIIAMAARLGLSVVAEGVENAGQAEFLRALGCERYQGFYWARPAPFERLVVNLRDRRGRTAAVAAPNRGTGARVARATTRCGE